MSPAVKRIGFVLLGTLFGFLLSRAGATNPDFYASLFLFTDLQLMQVMGAAAGVGVIGVAVMKRFGTASLMDGQPIAFSPKPMKKGLVVGSLMFGAGWGLSAACPGTAMAMIGEGRIAAVYVVAGIILGTWLHGTVQMKVHADQYGPGAGASAG